MRDVSGMKDNGDSGYRDTGRQRYRPEGTETEDMWDVVDGSFWTNIMEWKHCSKYGRGRCTLTTGTSVLEICQ